MTERPVVELECINGVYQVPAATPSRLERISALVVALFIAVMFPLINGPH